MGLCPWAATVCESVEERWSDEAGCLPTLGIRSYRGLHASLALLVDVTDFRPSRSSGENRVGGGRDVDACACAFVRARVYRFERQAECGKERDVGYRRIATVGC